jgi:hypothetical protein
MRDELRLQYGRFAHPRFGSSLAEVPQLSQHVLALKRLCGQIQAIFSITFWMIFGDVGRAKPRLASNWATGLSGRATRRRRSWPWFWNSEGQVKYCRCTFFGHATPDRAGARPYRLQCRIGRCDMDPPANTSHPLSRLFACFAGPLP